MDPTLRKGSVSVRDKNNKQGREEVEMKFQRCPETDHTRGRTQPKL